MSNKNLNLKFDRIFKMIKEGDIGSLEKILKPLSQTIMNNIRNAQGETLLHEAAFWNKHDIIKYLIETKKMDCYLVNRRGQSALTYAQMEHNKECVEYLVSKGVEYDLGVKVM